MSWPRTGHAFRRIPDVNPSRPGYFVGFILQIAALTRSGLSILEYSFSGPCMMDSVLRLSFGKNVLYQVFGLPASFFSVRTVTCSRVPVYIIANKYPQVALARIGLSFSMKQDVSMSYLKYANTTVTEVTCWLLYWASSSTRRVLFIITIAEPACWPSWIALWSSKSYILSPVMTGSWIRTMLTPFSAQKSLSWWLANF